MKTYNNVVIVFPDDPSIKFLTPILKVLIEIFPKAVISNPPVGSCGDDITDEADLVIFLGHGSTRFLYGSINESGEKSIFMDIPTAKRMLEGTSVILFSCNSWDYLRKFMVAARIDTFLSFGDMPTDWEHIRHNRENNATFLKDFTSEHLEFYKSCLVEAMISGFREGYFWNSFISIPTYASLFISKKINHVIFIESWNRSQKLQMIQLLVDFRREIKYSRSTIIS